MRFTETCYIPDMADEAAYETIKTALATLSGVQRLRPLLVARRLVITYATPATPELLRETIEATGYAVTNGLTALRPQR